MKKIKNVQDLLLVIDMVNGFVKEGALADTNIQRLIPYQKKLLEYFINETNKVSALVRDVHHRESAELLNYVSHCLEKTAESRLVKELEPYQETSLNYEKNCTCIIFNKAFERDIALMKDLKRIVITGCCTDICILNAALALINYFNQNDRNVEVVVPRLLTETYHIPEVHDREEYTNMAFKLMDQAGINIEMPNDVQKVLKR